jgi:hypothetical protein
VAAITVWRTFTFVAVETGAKGNAIAAAKARTKICSSARFIVFSPVIKMSPDVKNVCRAMHQTVLTGGSCGLFPSREF